MKIIIASSSKNRHELFRKMRIGFEVCEPDFEEVVGESLSSEVLVQNLALGKAQSVWHQYEEQDDFCILGFDSMIDFEGQAIGKAQDKQAAFNLLKKFVGKPQQIITGVALMGKVQGQKFETTIYQSTQVQFQPDISNDDIRAYLEFGDWSGKCGAYSILGTGVFFLEPVEGDFQNIVGVPVQMIGEKLAEITNISPFQLFTPV